MSVAANLDTATADNPCAHLLVRSWRLIMARGVECPLIAQEFKCACGAAGQQVFGSFCIFLCALAVAQRRCLLVNPPGAGALTADETRMLTLIAAAQNGCTSTLRAHLSWLARQALRGALEESVHELAAALRASHLRLPQPQ